MSEIQRGPIEPQGDGVSAERPGRSPQFQLDVFIAPHANPEDFKEIDELFKSADIIVPELAGWDQESVDYYKALSAGATPPRKYEDSGKAYNHLDELIFDSHKAIMFADVPAGHAILEQSYKGDEEMFSAAGFFLGGEFDEALEAMGRGVGMDAEFDKAREDYMRTQLEQWLPQAGDHFPALKDKAAINVLMPLGFVHTALVHDLQSDSPPGLKARMRLGDSPYTYSYLEQLSREMRNGNTAPGEELVAKALLDILLEKQLNEFMSGHVDKNKLKRQLTDAVSLEEMRALSGELGGAADSQQKLSILRGAIQDWFERLTTG